MYKDHGPVDAPHQESPMERAQCALQKQGYLLAETIERMDARLRPVCRPPVPTPVPTPGQGHLAQAVRPAPSQAVANIEEVSDRMLAMNRQLNDLLDRLDV